MADETEDDDKDTGTPEGKPDTPQDDLGDDKVSAESENGDNDGQKEDDDSAESNDQEADLRNQVKNLSDIVNQQAGVIEELRKSVASIMDADGKAETGQDDDSDSGNGAPSQDDNSGKIKTIEQLFGLEK